ncbi:hypothetical protein ACLIMP_00695 [Novosphingobium aerophilum]|uniref:hypothetical protein n=1 Tax=Novosphingobium TaxID=165696 RepID=UPI0006C8BF64|nr:MULTISPECIES: hypothetical protein [unclassified Novosphingobium]KPH67362.1 hypothetical protein ADT71_02340 [Novosphingobium sp. ST904]MPS69481.1 hypothetical protein [Novosphingobium sp.]TCM39280.1 hypothetical protein EDF59_106161 [Novosphingobium sp. ST904]WRT92836.1 hypothetical protein U9J33_16835 [Novosphingobium sp. RL4]
MRKIARFIAPALVAALGISAIAPGIAEAAPRHEAARYTPNREAKIRSDIAGLRSQIDRAAARRTISQREATGLRRDAAEIQRLHASYARGGLNPREMQTLESKINRVHAALHAERNDRNGHRR